MTNFLPMPFLTERQYDNFFKKIAVSSDPNGCHTWTANTSRTKKGYGEFRVGESYYRAHRIAFGIANGHLPTNLEIDHKCFNTSCVNPNHLEAVTGEENISRKNARIAAQKAAAEELELAA